MKNIYKLLVPNSAPNFLLRDSINIPCNIDGIKMADWWSTAPIDSRIAVITAGDVGGDYVTAWKKIASEILDKPSSKSEHDEKSVIARLEAANEAKGDPSGMSQPPITSP